MRLPIAAALALSVCSSAGVVHLRDYDAHEPKDRGVLFAMAIAPNSDVVSFVPKGDGKWRLTRIRGWAEPSPTDQTIDVPGWTWKKGSSGNPEFAYAEVFVTADGKYAVCAAHASWMNAGSFSTLDDLVSLVDLSSFTVVKTIRASDLGPEIWELSLDPAGNVVLQAQTSKPVDDFGRPNPLPQGFRADGLLVPGIPFAHVQMEMMLLSLPDLSSQGRCHFSKTLRPDIIAVKDEDCSTALTQVAGAPSLGKFLEKLDPNGLHERNDPESPCIPTKVTRDRRFEIQSCETHHLTAWNRNVVRDSSSDRIVSLENRQLLGTIKFSTRKSYGERLFDRNGRDYILVVEDGTKLKVYEIKP